MYLSELFDQLTYGELSQLAMGGINDIGIQPCDYPRVLPHINLALIELYKRFPLKVGQVLIQQDETIQSYHLNYKYAQSNTESLEPIKYIMDTVSDPFDDTVLKIEKIENTSDAEEDELFLNNKAEEDSYYTTDFNTVWVPEPDSNTSFTIKYRAAPPPLVQSDLTPANFTEVEVPISYTYIEPLVLYIAARVYSNLGSEQGQEGNTYMAKYEASVKRIEDLGLELTDETPNLKLPAAGWV